MGFLMRNFIQSYVCDETGAAAAEYALILAVVAAVIATAASGLAGAVANAINDAAGRVSSAA
jgi:pilus assembly protein Flp/PilA